MEIKKQELRIIFMGTPEFAVASLQLLIQNNYSIVGVVTVPDKPAGRGQLVQQSAVKKFALEKHLTILQPEKLKSEQFIADLKLLKADLQIVVAFRMLPEIVWQMPPLGTFNLHGSLLPRYRGAAPINWAVINGDKETGVTTFFLQHQIDTGSIIFRERLPIGENETAGDVHDKLMLLGASLVVKTVKAIEQNNFPQLNQDELIANGEEEKHAPKIFKEDCKINWTKNASEIHNFVRGLSPYPTAFTELVSPSGEVASFKIFKTERNVSIPTHPLKSIVTDSRTYLKIALSDGYLSILELQLAGKKRINITDYLRGNSINNEWRIKE